MRYAILAPSLLGFFLGTACIFVHAEDDSLDGQAHHHSHAATAKIEGRSGSSLTGKATFTEVEGGVLVDLEVHGASPGWHAVHIHENGDCSAADGSSAGGHFNPAGKNHGSPMAPDHHAGDLGSLCVDEHGDGRHVLLMPDLSVQDGPNSVRSRSIIVHEKGDDFATQPTGNAGGRIGCGVIR